MRYVDLIYLVGPPGAGKGTHAQLLQRDAGYVWLSTGNAMRSVARDEDSELGRRIRDLIDQGRLAPPDVAVQVITEEAAPQIDAGSRLVLDGSPRTVEEADRLDEFFEEHGYSSRMLLYLSISRDEMIRRNSRRKFCLEVPQGFPVETDEDVERCRQQGGRVGTRPDDRPEKLATRWDEFLQQTYPVVERYRRKGSLREVDGHRTIDQVHAEVMESIRDGRRRA